MTIQITEADIGWMAGVLSIKGRIMLKQNGSRATSQKVIAVRSQRKSVIDRLAILTDRHVRSDKPVTKAWDQRGCIEHCPQAHVHHGGDIPATFEWTVTGVSAAIIVYNLLPYLPDTDDWVQLMTVAISDAVISGQGSGATKSAAKRLSEIGWRLPGEVLDLIAAPVPAIV